MTLINLADGDLRLEVNPRGAHIAQIYSRDRTLLATVGSRHELGAGGSEREWIAAYPGGWHLVTPNVDTASGTRSNLPFHGEAAWAEWDVIASTATRIQLRVQLRTLPLELTRTVTIQGRSVIVAQSFFNLSDSDASLEWTEHTGWGGALLGPNMTLHVDDDAVQLARWSPTQPSGLFSGIPTKLGRYQFRNEDEHIVVEVSFDPELMPWVIIWQEHRRLGSPWFGQVDAIGIEPSSTDFAGTIPHERQMLIVPAGQTISSTLTVNVIDLNTRRSQEKH